MIIQWRNFFYQLHPSARLWMVGSPVDRLLSRSRRAGILHLRFSVFSLPSPQTIFCTPGPFYSHAGCSWNGEGRNAANKAGNRRPQLRGGEVCWEWVSSNMQLSNHCECSTHSYPVCSDRVILNYQGDHLTLLLLHYCHCNTRIYMSQTRQPAFFNTWVRFPKLNTRNIVVTNFFFEILASCWTWHTISSLTHSISIYCLLALMHERLVPICATYSTPER